MKTLLLVLVLSIASFAQSVNYDKFDDKTTISGERVRVAGILMQPQAVEKDNKLYYFLTFRSASNEWRFLRSRTLIFLADGERINLGEGQREGKIERRGVTERLLYSLTKDELTKLANSASLEMRLGMVEAKLDEREKKGMKELLGYGVK